jgi:hypothetical protein
MLLRTSRTARLKCAGAPSCIYHIRGPVDNEEAFHHRTVDACQTIRNYSGICERVRRSMMRRVEACIEYHRGHFEHLF